jgi:tetratricopeptide (TPR) repeat protein
LARREALRVAERAAPKQEFGVSMKTLRWRSSVTVAALAAALCLLPFSPTPAAPQAKPSAEVPLSIIVVKSRQEAEQILTRLKAGEPFSALVAERSIDPTAANGGYLGMMDPVTLRHELRDALQGVGRRQFTPIVQIPEGYAILEVMESAPGGSSQGLNPSRIPASEAPGTVKYLPDVSGIAEVISALAKFPKPPGWNQDPSTICQMRKQSTADFTATMEHLLAPENQEAMAGYSARQQMMAHHTLGELYASQGDMDRAIAQYQIEFQIASARMPLAVPLTELFLGTAYFHKSEMENDVYRHPGERCLFPMPPGTAYAKTADSEKAVEYFLRYLQQRPTELDVKWQLNLAYMTLGKYPDGVPKEFLIPPSAFASPENVGRFVDVAPEAGIEPMSGGGGIIVDDFENNGLLDVATSSPLSCDPMHYFHNNGDGTFTNRAEQAGLSGQLGGNNLLQADYNNDGCLDILVLRGGWDLPQRRSLLRNDCHGVFTDVTASSGLAVPATSTQTAVWADINNDGWLDLFLGNEEGPSQLFLNQGDGTFKDISHSAGVDKIAVNKGVVAGDYDNDGYVDFYVSSLTGPNFLFHNNHNNTFTEVAAQAGVVGNGRGFAAWFFDYDNDGWPDLFVTSYSVSVDETLRTYLGLPHHVSTMKLYRNLGNGTFQDVTEKVGLDKVFMPMGANFGDIDNDGFLDIYLGVGNPSYNSELPQVLLRNDAGKRFVDVTTSSGTGELHKGHGVAFADLDRRGYEDLLEVVGGAVPGDRHDFRLFENPGNGNDWINVKLVGVKTNRAAIGARIKVTVEKEQGGTQSFYRTVGSGGSFGASPLEQHIGLGKSARILSIETWWPASNTRQTFKDVGKDQFLEIKEFAKTYSKLIRRPYRLGGAKRKLGE